MEIGRLKLEKREETPLMREVRFLSAQADRLAGASREEKASACSVRSRNTFRDAETQMTGRVGTGQRRGHDPFGYAQDRCIVPLR
jgi:hypothetical protein